MVKAGAFNGHQHRISRRQFFVFAQLAESGFLPAPIEIGLRLELQGIGAPRPIAQDDALLGVPIAG